MVLPLCPLKHYRKAKIEFPFSNISNDCVFFVGHCMTYPACFSNSISSGVSEILGDLVFGMTPFDEVTVALAVGFPSRSTSGRLSGDWKMGVGFGCFADWQCFWGFGWCRTELEFFHLLPSIIGSVYGSK